MIAQIGALGPKDFVMPFGAVGAKTFIAENSGQAREQAQAMLKENFAVIMMHEGLAEDVGPIFESVQERATPCVVSLPFIEPSTGQAVQQLRSALRRATGTDIWSSAGGADSQPLENKEDV